MTNKTRTIMEALEDYCDRHLLDGHWSDVLINVCEEIVDAEAKVHSLDADTLMERLSEDDPTLSKEVVEDDNNLFNQVMHLVDADEEPYEATDKVIEEYLKANS